MSVLERVPTLVVAGRPGAGKTTLIARLLGERPPGEIWAVLANERGAARIAPADGVAVAAVDGGCMCCTAQVALRVGLTRLLREARPRRLFVELNAASHLPEVLRTLRDPWLAPVLALAPTVEVIDASVGESEHEMLSRIAAAEVLCVRGDTRRIVPLAGDRLVVAAAGATLASLGAAVSAPA